MIHSMATFPCPSCARPLEADEEYRDWTVRCPHCAAEFVPEEAAPAAFHHTADDPDAAARELAEAQARAFGPGICIELCGWCFGFMIEVGAFFRMMIALAEMNNPALRKPNDSPELALVMSIMLGMIGLPYSLLLIIGGRKMRELSSISWALVASIAAVGSFAFFYVLCICAFVPTLFGVWGLVALGNTGVRHAFAANRARQWEG